MIRLFNYAHFPINNSFIETYRTSSIGGKRWNTSIRNLRPSVRRDFLNRRKAHYWVISGI